MSTTTTLYTASNNASVVGEEGARIYAGQELVIATHLANNGYNVRLLATSKEVSVKTPDAFLQSNHISGFAEFKMITESATNIPLAVQRQLRNGKKQASWIILYIAFST
ncbi:MAG: hypothetical protein MUF71_20805 [Candidatus Kapabacteria bacterium]|jgi:hypothetical protein|nr:hypothetical protein [Candidatus Kapabacteria bacterium]